MVVLITGSSKNIGKAIALKFAKEGYDIIINYNNSEKEALKLKENIEKTYKVKTLAIKCDISNEESIQNMIKIIEEKYKKIDVLVNNAAIEINTEFNKKTKQDFEKVINTNLIGTFLVTKYISKKMDKGYIINISSNNAINKNDPTTLEYDASKAALISLTHNLAKQLSPNINVNCIAPGWVETKEIKQLDEELENKFIKEESKKILKNRFAKEEEIASLVYYLTTNEYINDSIITIDGGSK